MPSQMRIEAVFHLVSLICCNPHLSTVRGQMITQPPESITAALGTNATFSCHGIGRVLWQINGTQVRDGTRQVPVFANIQVFVPLPKDSFSELTMTATRVTNATSVKCIVDSTSGLVESVKSGAVRLLVYAEPDPPVDLNITVDGLNLVATWNKPFSLQAEELSYIVYITNEVNGIQVKITINTTTYVLSEPIGQRDCADYMFIVFSNNSYNRSETGITGHENIPTGNSSHSHFQATYDGRSVRQQMNEHAYETVSSFREGSQSARNMTNPVYCYSSESGTATTISNAGYATISQTSRNQVTRLGHVMTTGWCDSMRLTRNTTSCINTPVVPTDPQTGYSTLLRTDIIPQLCSAKLTPMDPCYDSIKERDKRVLVGSDGDKVVAQMSRSSSVPPSDAKMQAACSSNNPVEFGSTRSLDLVYSSDTINLKLNCSYNFVKLQNVSHTNTSRIQTLSPSHNAAAIHD